MLTNQPSGTGCGPGGIVTKLDIRALEPYNADVLLVRRIKKNVNFIKTIRRKVYGISNLIYGGKNTNK